MIRERRLMLAILIAAASIAPISAQGRWSPGATRPPQPALAIEQAVREALDRNLNLLAERFNVKVADTAVLTASLKPNPVVTVNLMRPDQVLVDAGISPHEQVFRTDYVFERGGKRERRVDQATLSKAVAELRRKSLQTCKPTGYKPPAAGLLQMKNRKRQRNWVSGASICAVSTKARPWTGSGRINC